MFFLFRQNNLKNDFVQFRTFQIRMNPSGMNNLEFYFNLVFFGWMIMEQGMNLNCKFFILSTLKHQKQKKRFKLNLMRLMLKRFSLKLFTV